MADFRVPNRKIKTNKKDLPLVVVYKPRAESLFLIISLTQSNLLSRGQKIFNIRKKKTKSDIFKKNLGLWGSIESALDIVIIPNISTIMQAFIPISPSRLKLSRLARLSPKD